MAAVAETGAPAILRAASRDLRDVRFGAAVYGSFLIASVIGVAFESGASARTMTLSALGSSLVFWLAHAWSEAVGTHIARASALSASELVAIARHEWPLVEAAGLPILAVALAWAGVWSREAGAVSALAVAVVQIAAWGYVACLRAGGRPAVAALHGTVQGAFGVALLLLERLVH